MIAGLDEAGRGSFIGRVYSSCVVVDENFIQRYKDNNEKIVLRDSKKLSEKKRDAARKFIETYAPDYVVSFSDREEIEQQNILQATLASMRKCLDGLRIRPDKIMVDGPHFTPYEDIPHECIIKGDDSELSIACASILAKTHRDEYIKTLCEENPCLTAYDIMKNKGYGTKCHLDAIKKWGPTEFHRKTFGICRQYNKEKI